MISEGIKGLLSSRKGTLSLIIVTAITVLSIFGKLEGMSYAAVIASVQMIFCWTQNKADVAAINQGTPNGP